MARNGAKSVRLEILELPGEFRVRTWVQWVRTFYRVQRRLVEALMKEGLTLPQFDVLATLRFSEGVTQQELAVRLLVTKGNVCGVLDRLEALDWVQRCTDPADRRANHLHLTPAGRKKLDAVLPEHDALVMQALSPLSAAEVTALRGMLESVDRALGEE